MLVLMMCVMTTQSISVLVSNSVNCTLACSPCLKTLSEICVAVLKKLATGKDCPQSVDYDSEPKEVSSHNGWKQVDSEALQFWELEALEFGTHIT